MDPVTLSTIAATVVATGALEEVGGNVVNLAGEKLSALKRRVNGWLADNDDSEGELVEAYERATERQTELSIKGLADAIKVAADKDPDGAAKIAELIEELHPGATSQGPTFNTNVTDNAQVGNITNIAGDMTVND